MLELLHGTDPLSVAVFVNTITTIISIGGFIALPTLRKKAVMERILAIRINDPMSFHSQIHTINAEYLEAQQKTVQNMSITLGIFSVIIFGVLLYI